MKEVAFESLLTGFKEIIILVGVPGSGKTTVAEKLVAKGYKRFSADAIRGEVYGDENIQGEGNYIFNILHHRMTEAFEAGHCIVVDNVNIKSRDRQEFLNKAFKYNYKSQIWVMSVPLETALERNKLRERKVPPDVIARMHQGLQAGNIYGSHVKITNIDEPKFFVVKNVMPSGVATNG